MSVFGGALSFGNSIFSNYAFYTSACTVKMVGLGMLVTYRRVSGSVYSNPEDCKGFGDGNLEPKLNDAKVERARRNHMNDLENLVPFAVVGLLYSASGPSQSMALLHFRLFTAARFLHTICYQVPLPQPSRFLCHLVSIGVVISMGVQVIKNADW